MTDWTTRIDPSITRQYGVEAIHNVWLAPKDWSGKGPVVGLLIPECEFQVCALGSDGKPVLFVNRPPKNKNIMRWIRFACEEAMGNAAVFSLACDTAEQAERATRSAMKLLRGYERVPLERMYQADTRGRGGPN